VENPLNYDPRYLAGIRLFNDRDFFQAHDVWEELWNDCPNIDRRFHQGLIQAAVALYHWSNGNWRGARRLFHSGRAYMSAYPDPHRGLAIGRFWQQMERAAADVLKDPPPATEVRLNEDLAPRIELDPPPTFWPDPHQLLPEE